MTSKGLASLWPVPSSDDDKYSRGVVGVDTGSARYPGAAILSVLGALRGGAGFVRYCGTESAKEAIVSRCPSITLGLGQVNAWVLGCGWEEDAANAKRLASRVADDLPCLLDAGALSVIDEALALTGRIHLPSNSLLTPHAGELARLLGTSRPEVEADPVGSAGQAAERFQATVLIKGARQYCLAPDGSAIEALAGPAWTAQAGSGDVLAGLAGTLLAAGLSAQTAGAAAASLQALAAQRHPGPYSPDQLADRFPETIAELSLLSQSA